MIKGIAFDLDGTLTKPAIDFEGVREKIGGLKSGMPIYEQILEMSEPGKTRALGILEEEEERAARNAEPNPGLYELIDYLEKRHIRKAIFTRNSRASLEITLSYLHLVGRFSPMVSREMSFKLKPSPEQILYILQEWRVSAQEVLVVGDFLFDILAGKSAGCRTVYINSHFLNSPQPQADYSVNRLDQIIAILEELNGKRPGSG